MAGERTPINPIKPFGETVRKVAGMNIGGTPKKEREDLSIIKARMLVPVFDLFDKALEETDINPNDIEGINIDALERYLELNPDSFIQQIAGSGLQRMLHIADLLHDGKLTSLSDLDIEVIRFVNWQHQNPM